MADDDMVYLLRRAAEEKKLAALAGNGEARLAHQGMADAYEQRVRDTDSALITGAEAGTAR